MARQVLTIAGTVVGAAFGMPQLGFALGSLIGNAVDPVQIQGPKIGELQVQTSRDGVPRPIIFGVACVSGNVIDRSKPKIVKKKERQGKGGPEVTTERVYMSYAIRICEGEIQSVSKIWENEKLVYDGGSTGDFLDQPSFIGKFLGGVLGMSAGLNARIYFGGEDQMPDPTFEAIHGVGNNPAYRGTAYIVFKDKDLTDFGGAIPQYRFEVNGPMYEDPYAANVVSLLHFDEGDGATSFVDQIPGGWFAYGGTITSAQRKYGASSVFVTHTQAVGSKTLGGWNNEKKFTAEAWIYRQSISVSEQYFFCLSPRNGNTAACRVVLSDTTKRLNLWVSGVGTASSTVAPPLNQWAHLAMCCDGSKYYLFLDGVKVCELNGVISETTNTLYWEPSYAVDGGIHFTGYMDEIRLTKGVCRYPGGASFTPPDKAFLNP